MIQARSMKIRGLPKVYCFSTFFYPSLCSHGYQWVSDWRISEDIFDHDILLIPIHTPTGVGHWSMVAVYVRKKQLKYYDSLSSGAESCLQILMEYLKLEHQMKKNSPLDATNWSQVIERALPRQLNSYDCGVFCCKYGDFIATKSPLHFQQSDIPYFRKLMIYEVVKGSLWTFDSICDVCNDTAVIYDGARTRGRPKRNSKPGFPCYNCRRLIHLTCMSKASKELIYGCNPFETIFTCDKCQNQNQIIQIEISYEK